LIEVKHEHLSVIRKAEDFHGHLGPFLVIGVRMGLIGLTRLGAAKRKTLTVNASLPLRVPFSCIIDGLQITTKCTIGNQRLSLKESASISVTFTEKDSPKELRVALNQSMRETLRGQLLQDTLSKAQMRELAWKVADAPETDLFNIY
jgi:formylmethanofuran dehydrogenase subunit E